MVAHVSTVAFQGVDVVDVDVQVHIGGGLPAFAIVGLPDKTVAEARERVRAALSALGLALPAKRLTVNLSPADLLKEGSHYDLPIALGLLIAMGVIEAGPVANYAVIGELALDGKLTAVAGALPAAMGANAAGRGLICPAACGGEAAWAGGDVLAPDSLLGLINHLKGTQVLSPPAPKLEERTGTIPDLRDIKGQETAKRALEVAAAGGHHLLMVGPPGSGKSMLAQRLPGLLPPLSPSEALEVSMIHSVAGFLAAGGLSRQRPYRDPHHTSSQVALIGGGLRAKPGEISLAHLGVLFLVCCARKALMVFRKALTEARKALMYRSFKKLDFAALAIVPAGMYPGRRSPCGLSNGADGSQDFDNLAGLFAIDFLHRVAAWLRSEDRRRSLYEDGLLDVLGRCRLHEGLERAEGVLPMPVDD